MKTFDLVPTNGRKSFSGKAIVKQNDNISVLTSYNTKVAQYDHNTNIITVNGYYSPTTASHINAFLNFYGFDSCTKKELENYNN